MLNRRHILRSAGSVAAAFSLPDGLRSQSAAPLDFGYPITNSAGVPGDGFLIRHGYATENSWYLPGYWHTGEDWYALDGATAGAQVVAVGPGEVVFAGSDYPGRVVIVRHAPDLYSMYGHLAFELAVAAGQTVARGDPLGTVLARGDDVPDHLHIEVRTFFTTPDVNGEAPRYGFSCGPNCPAGPGYWPIAAPEHPSALGWRNPTHLIASTTAADQRALPARVVVAEGAPASLPLWSSPADDGAAEQIGTLTPTAGDRLPLLGVASGAPDATGTSAEAYRLWYRVALPDDATAWVQAALPADGDTGGDGRPSSIRFALLPAPAGA